MKRLGKLAAAAMLALAALFGGVAGGSAQTRPEGEMRFAVYVTIPPAWLDPGETGPGFLSAVLDPLCTARRADEADAGQPHGAEPGGIVDREPGQAGL